MAEPPDRPRPPQDDKALRAARVAAALRENLRRRKEQARARAALQEPATENQAAPEPPPKP